MTTATVIPGVLGFLLSTTPVPSVTPTPIPAAMATAKAKHDRLELVQPSRTATPRDGVPQHWKDEAREYRKIRDWADQQEHMMRAAQDILHEDADAYDWTAKREDVDPEVARTSRMMADALRRDAKKLRELEFLMLNVNVAATNGIKRRHLNPFKDDDSVGEVMKKAWYDPSRATIPVAFMAVLVLGLIAFLIILVRAAKDDDKEASQK